MDTALPQNFSFILDRNLAKANCTENRVCTSCDKVVLDIYVYRVYKVQVQSWTMPIKTKNKTLYKNDKKRLTA